MIYLYNFSDFFQNNIISFHVSDIIIRNFTVNPNTFLFRVVIILLENPR